MNQTSPSQNQETILQVGCEGGSLSIKRFLDPNGNWRFMALMNEKAMAGFLNEEDRAGLSFYDESPAVDTFEAALHILDQYRWYKLHPITLHQEYQEIVLAEILKRGTSLDVKEWRIHFADQWHEKR